MLTVQKVLALGLLYLVMMFGEGAVIGHSHNGNTQIHAQGIAQGQTAKTQ